MPVDAASLETLLRHLDGVAGDPAQSTENAALFNEAAAAIRALAAKAGQVIDD